MIPRIVHYCWMGKQPYPRPVAKCIRSWRRLGPGWVIKKWDETNYPKGHPYLDEAYRSGNYSNASNFIRLYAVYQEGGIYLDADVEIVQSLEALLKESCFFGFQADPMHPEAVNDAVMGAAPHHPLVGHMLRELPRRFDGREVSALSGPRFTTEILKEKGVDLSGGASGKTVRFENIAIFPARVFHPFRWDETFSPDCVKPDTLTLHHWLNSWSGAVRNRPSLWDRLKPPGDKILTALLPQRRLAYGAELLDKTTGAARLIMGLKHIHGPRLARPGRNSAVVITVVKNGERYLPAFIEHYFALGAGHIVFLDNGSTDKTVDIARRHRNVTVLQTKVPMIDKELVFENYLMDRFSKHGWCLNVDIDELFDYPFSDRVSFPRLLEYLNRNDYTACVAQMLDLFPEESLEAASKNPAPFRETYRYYDTSCMEKELYDGPSRDKSIDNTQNVASNPDIPFLFGGIRKRVFGTNNALTKHPLLFADGKIEIYHPHCVRNARCADFSAVLYHYPFVDFAPKIRRYLDEKYGAQPEYVRYQARLDQPQPLVLQRDGARRLGAVRELVDSGFLHCSAQFSVYAREARKGFKERGL